MHKYAKFCKDILLNKCKLKEHKSVMLIKEITALQNNLLPKSNNQESFTISYTIGNSHFDKVLCDLGKYINLIFFLFSKNLDLEM